MPTTAPASPEPLVNVAAVAELLGVPISFVYEKASRGELPAHRVGRYLRFRVSEIEAWLDEQQTWRGRS